MFNNLATVPDLHKSLLFGTQGMFTQGFLRRIYQQQLMHNSSLDLKRQQHTMIPYETFVSNNCAVQ